MHALPLDPRKRRLAVTAAALALVAMAAWAASIPPPTPRRAPPAGALDPAQAERDGVPFAPPTAQAMR